MALNNTQVNAAKPKDKPYKMGDGKGMFLLVHPNGSKYWRMSYRFNRKQKTIALGVYPELSIADARKKRTEYRDLINQGVDPSEARKEKRLEEQRGSTFEEVARNWHQSNQKWSDVHRRRVIRSLELYIFPHIGNTPIKDLQTRDLLPPIRHVIQEEKYETATQLQQRIGAVMRYAVQNGIIDYNPAQDAVGYVPPARTRHRPALDLDKITDLLKRIENFKGRPLTRFAVELTMLTFVRSSELRFARWPEIDFKHALWTIPPKRKPIKGVRYSHRGSKMQTPHLVPLSQQSLKVIKSIYEFTGNHKLIFTGDHNPQKAMSENTVNKALRSMGYDTKTEICAHGFRAMACSALIESGIWSKDAVERQMSHQERDSVRAAYITKADHLEERRLMMQWWADFIDANKEKPISPFQYAKINDGGV